MSQGNVKQIYLHNYEGHHLKPNIQLCNYLFYELEKNY